MQTNKLKRARTVAVRAATSLLPCLFWVALIFGFDTEHVAILTILCALLHELGHTAVLLLIKKDFSLFGASSGVRIGGFGIMSYREEILAALGGPLANIAIFLVCIPFLSSDYVRTIAVLSALTAISNLLPLEGYDGYRILSALASGSRDPSRTQMILRRISFTLTVILVFLSLYLIGRVNSGYWIFFLFIISLFRSFGEGLGTICEETGENKSF